MNPWYVFPRRRFVWCPPRHLALAALLTQLLRRFAPTHRRIIQCLRLRSHKPSVGCLDIVGWTTADPSVHPVLNPLLLAAHCLEFKDHLMNHYWLVGSSGATTFVLARLYLDSNKTSDKSTLQPTRCRFIQCCWSLWAVFFQSSGASRKGTVGSSDGALLLFLCVFNLFLAST
jgi:hypothetical protein